MKTYTAKELNEAVKKGKTVEVTKTVIFYSPGTFVAETNSYESKLKSTDAIIKEATEKSKGIEQRYGAVPYGFSIEGKKGMYFLPHCKKLHYNDIPDTKENETLKRNMKNNDWDYVVQTTTGWKTTLPFTKNDVLLS